MSHLYMEQVTSFFDDVMYETRRKEGDKILTKTMINNYTKHEVLKHPIKKKYSKEHMIALIYIIMLKRVLSMQDIKSFFEIAKGKEEEEQKLEPVYDIFQGMLEKQSDEIILSLDKKMDTIDRELAKGGLTDDASRLMTLIATLSYEASSYKLLVERLIDKYDKIEKV